MNDSTHSGLDSFTRLDEAERLEVESAIIGHMDGPELPPVSDEEQTLAAEAIFLELDADEMADGRG